MVIRRPIVLSGQFLHEADDTDGQVILGRITYGSGLGDISNNYEESLIVDTFLADSASGLLLVPEGVRDKLALDGADEDTANSALASGNLALTEVAPASASGLEAARIAVEALASGNAALLANASGLQLSDAAVTLTPTALASGNAALARATDVFDNSVNALSSGNFAYGSGVAANTDSVGALSSGNAALTILGTNPFISEDTLLGLVIALS